MPNRHANGRTGGSYVRYPCDPWLLQDAVFYAALPDPIRSGFKEVLTQVVELAPPHGCPSPKRLYVGQSLVFTTFIKLLYWLTKVLKISPAG